MLSERCCVFLLLPALFAVQSVRADTDEIKHQYFVKRNGLRNLDGILDSFEARSHFACAAACDRERQCNSYNVGPVLAGSDGRQVCDLVTTDQHSVGGITEAPGWSMFVGE